MIALLFGGAQTVAQSGRFGARSRRFGARRLKSRDVGFILPLELRGLLRRDCEL